MDYILWLNGIYRSAYRRGFGGGERSFYAKKLLSKELDMKIIDVFWLDHTCLKPIGEDYICIPISGMGKFIRAFMKILRSISNKFYFDIIGLRGNRKYFLKNIRTPDNTYGVCIIDGIYGLMMAYHLFKDLRDLCDNIIYLSHNFEPEYFAGTVVNKVVRNVEKFIALNSDLVIASTLRDKLKYIENYTLSPEKISVLPNIYPEQYFPREKYDELTIAIIEGTTGIVAKHMAEYLSKKKIIPRILYIGKHKPIIENVELIYYKFIKSRSEFLSVLSSAHIGLNIGVKKGGSNVKRYDYALAGLYIFSNIYGSRGEYLPGESVYIDKEDLICKLYSIDKEQMLKLSRKNKEYALNIQKEYKKELINRLKSLICK